MDLTKILAISGRPGLYRMISETKNGFLVESLDNQKRFPVFTHQKVSSLEEISIFTADEDIPLKDVFKRIHDALEGEKAPDHKGNLEELRVFFQEAVPDYDQERVYNSDIKKVIHWYNLLTAHGLLDFTEEPEQEKKEEPEEKVAAADTARKKAKKAKTDDEKG